MIECPSFLYGTQAQVPRKVLAEAKAFDRSWKPKLEDVGQRTVYLEAPLGGGDGFHLYEIEELFSGVDDVVEEYATCDLSAQERLLAPYDWGALCLFFHYFLVTTPGRVAKRLRVLAGHRGSELYGAVETWDGRGVDGILARRWGPLFDGFGVSEPSKQGLLLLADAIDGRREAELLDDTVMRVARGRIATNEALRSSFSVEPNWSEFERIAGEINPIRQAEVRSCYPSAIAGVLFELRRDLEQRGSG